MSDNDKENDDVEKIMLICKTAQCMIEVTAKQLFGLRTQCATTEEITQQEIRETESKLIKLFSQQLIAKSEVPLDGVPEELEDYPNMEAWLKVVGLGDDIIEGIIGREIVLVGLLEMSEGEVHNLLVRFNADSESICKLNSALHNLKIWTKHELHGDSSTDSDMELHWTSYKSASNSPHDGYRSRPSTSSLPPDNFAVNNNQSPDLPTSPYSNPSSPAPSSPAPRICNKRLIHTPPPTPPLIRPRITGIRYPSTPPPKKRMQLFPEYPLTKSKSSDFQVANRVTDIDPVKIKKKPNNLNFAGNHDDFFPRRLSNDGSDAGRSSRGPSGHTSPVLINSPLAKPIDNLNFLEDQLKGNMLSVPRSPKTPYGTGPRMSHAISHRFTNMVKIMPINCDFCHRQMFIGYRCKECKFKCHKDCASKAAPACKLPKELMDVFLISIQANRSPGSSRRIAADGLDPGWQMKPAISVPVFHVPDSSSNTSSCNSSTPSSPALQLPSSASMTSPSPAVSPHVSATKFLFPGDGKVSRSDHTCHADPSTGRRDCINTTSVQPDVDNVPRQDLPNDSAIDMDFINTDTSNDSEKTLVDSNNSEKTLPDRVDSLDSQDDSLGHSWRRENSLSVTLKEWDIPYEDLNIDEVIGRGSFGTVYKGQWHGDVAIKMLNMDPAADNKEQLNKFKLEVAMLRKTRHQNLVLFMGACMKPPHLAMITSLCKGQTLHTILHLRRDRFPLNKVIMITSQIAQGMGYLHARGIVHKDLKTKNIFYENGGKIVITDFGLFNVTKLCHGNRKGDWLSISQGWLCYLSPEIIRCLHATSKQAHLELPFTEESDIYAIGTVLYEQLCGEWPFKNQPPESIIWQVGRGIKQSLCSVQVSKDVKDILLRCWSYTPTERPDFSRMMKSLERIPKRLFRSPSHPPIPWRSENCLYHT